MATSAGELAAHGRHAASSFEQLCEQLCGRAAELKALADLRTPPAAGGGPVKVPAAVVALAERLARAEAAMDAAEAKLAREEAAVREMEMLTARAASHTARCQKRHQEVLDVRAAQQAAVRAAAAAEAAEAAELAAGVEAVQVEAGEEETEERDSEVAGAAEPKGGGVAEGNMSGDSISVGDAEGSEPAVAVAPWHVRGVSGEELRSVPSYLRGRLTQPLLERAVEEINAVLERKYTLLAVPAGRVKGKVDRDLHAMYREQETVDLDGMHFFTTQDLKRCSVAKQDSTGKAALATLRHLGRLRQVSGQGLARLVVNTGDES